MDENMSVTINREPEEDAPYLSSPYPKRIEQVAEPDTEGEERIVNLIKEMWPTEIKELEKEAANREWGRNGTGYSGSFIRQVLRNHFAPATGTRVFNEEDNGSIEDRLREREEEGGDEYLQCFRAGLRIALTTDISEEEASEALASGFHEGRDIKHQMEKQ